MNKTTAYQAGPIDQEIIHKFIDAALAEDLGDGDHTTLSTIPEDAPDAAHLLVKEDGIIAGVELAKMIFHRVDPSLQVNIEIQDGTFVKRGDIVLRVHGKARSITIAERLVLNCMQRMSGIATHTQELVALLQGLDTKVIDTRKTTPLFRYFEKWAVRIGGGTNHRFGLYDMILIKDNHVDYAGGIYNAIDRANDYLLTQNRNLKIEVEVRNLDELEQALHNGKIHRIMLDNFSPSLLHQAIQRINKQYETEASGGITAETIRAYAETGVDFISVGALTHHVNSLDLSLKATRA
jgi:nicotinate-nucleotide pyrophosphorylase (carboxylating)